MFTRNSPLSSFKTDPWRLLQVGEAGRRIARQIGRKEPVPLIAMPHHDNHAWFPFSVSPFGHSDEPVMVAVLDGSGDIGAISLYLCAAGQMRQLYCNYDIFDSLGIFYAVISSTQGRPIAARTIETICAAIGENPRSLYCRRMRQLFQERANAQQRWINRRPHRRGLRSAPCE